MVRRSFGNIRKLPSGRFQARYIGPDGRDHKAPQTFDTRADANGWLAVQQADVIRDTWRPPTAVHAERVDQVATLFGEYAEEVIARRLAGGKIRATTAALYRRLTRLHFDQFATLPLAAITPRLVTSWHAQLSSTPTSRANAYGLLATIMGSAVRDELIVRSPCRVEAGGVKKSTRDEGTDVITTAEFRAYLAAAPQTYRMPLAIAFWCGLRSGEVRGLRRADVDLLEGAVTVAQQVVKLAGQNVVQREAKTAAGHRRVAMPSPLVADLREWLADQPVRGRNALLFTSPTGGPMSGESLRAAAKKAAVAIGRPELRVHSLRHSSATLAAQAGATTAEMMGRFGWATAAMAARYSHPVRERDQALAAKLSAM